MFQDETLIVEIQKILLQKGHYICGFSVQKNNLKSLFGFVWEFYLPTLVFVGLKKWIYKKSNNPAD